MTCDGIEPNLVAYADQRIATTATFIDAMVAGEAADVALKGADDALAVCTFSAVLDRHLTHKAAVTDALALAIRRLAR